MGDHNNLIQYKFEIMDKQSFLDQAKKVDIIFSDPVNYEYTYFKMPDSNNAAFVVLRIKVSEGKQSVDMKIRDDDTNAWRHFETNIDNPQEMQSILENIGCKPIVTFHKNRMSYVKYKYRMDVDESPEAGCFLEFKFHLEDKEEMMKLLNNLGFKEEDKDGRSVVEIYLEKNNIKI